MSPDRIVTAAGGLASHLGAFGPAPASGPRRNHFYVNNLQGDLDATVAAANSPTGALYPVGSVIQLIPGEAMVKRRKGFNPATRDWEFFELDVSKHGTRIRKRGFVDVVNRFGGTALDVTLPLVRSGISSARRITAAHRFR